MNKTKIEWCDATWNPVTGCYHQCSYCYARRIAQRFGKFAPSNLAQTSHVNEYGDIFEVYIEERGNPYPFLFAPTLHHSRIAQYDCVKNKNIFVCSMADLFGEWVPDNWIYKVMDKCDANKNNNYLFLTKNPSRYFNILSNKNFDISNMWFGVTLTGSEDLDYTYKLLNDMQRLRKEYGKDINLFISIEPLLNYFTLSDALRISNLFDWIIIGAETGNSKSKIVPELYWIFRIYCIAMNTNTPVFMKNSLLPLMEKDFEDYFSTEFPKKLKNKE